MRKVICAMNVSLDGYIEGANGELDWIENWEDSYGLMEQVDTCVLGAAMYPGYEQFWSTVLAAPGLPLPFTGKPATQGEIDYAKFTQRTPHVVLSKSLTSTGWKTTCFVRELNDIARLKQQPGKDIYAVGGATLVASLIEQGLVDELRLAIHPVLLGRGKALFKPSPKRHKLVLAKTRSQPWGTVELTYRLEAAE
ncbi:MAG: dihydrofolate reductase family protein [Burkholderiales bacterium]